MNVFFVSDLHLTSDDPQAINRFASFVKTLPQPNDVLILGGDIFDLFIGAKEIFQAKFHRALEAIRQAAQGGVKVYYLEGNHDFYLAKVFADHQNIEVRAEDFPLELNGKKFFISHGDRIDPEDTGYHFLRFVTRSGWFRILVDIVPGVWIERIGNRSSQESRKYNNPQKGGPENQQRLRALYLDFAKEKIREGAQHVLVGHSHLRDQILVEEGGTKGEYLNLGFSSDLIYGVLGGGADRFQVKKYA